MENAVIVRLRHFFYWGLQLMDIFFSCLCLFMIMTFLFFRNFVLSIKQ